MATFNFKFKKAETEKAIQLVLAESTFCEEKMGYSKEVSHWIPKSLITIDGNTASVPDWFYNKNIAVDIYGAFMKSLANS